MTSRQTRSLDQVRERIVASSAAEVIAGSIEAARAIADRGAFITLADRADAGDGLLAGVPLAVKDNLDTLDFPTTGGTPALADSRPGRDQHAVERLRAAGAVVIGKTNLHELALGITSNNAAFGPVRNPHDPSRSAGGSSGGSAVAVATGVVPIALGTDTGGSVRIPAAYCGVVGWRPTVGLGHRSHRPDLAHPRHRRCPRHHRRRRRTRRRDRHRRADGGPAGSLLRIGVPRAGFYDDLHPEVAAGAERTLARLADAGVELVEVEVARAHEFDAECGFPIVFVEIARDLPAYLATLPGAERDLTFADVLARAASPDVRGALEVAAAGGVTEQACQQALATRDRLRAAYAAALHGDDSRLDALVYPTVPLPAPPVGDDDTTELNGWQVPVFLTTIRNTGPGSTAGTPAVSLPAVISGVAR